MMTVPMNFNLLPSSSLTVGILSILTTAWRHPATFCRLLRRICFAEEGCTQ